MAKKVKTPDYIDVHIEVANLEEGVKLAQTAEEDGYELIISRGGTATMIQEKVSLPVVPIDVTGYDMLRVFTLIKEMNNKVALLGFANISRGAATLCDILEFNVKMITIQSRDEVKRHLLELKQAGYSVVIGDVVTVQEAKQIGLRGVLITSGKEALMDAFEEAKRLYELFYKSKTSANYVYDAMNNMPIPIAVSVQNQIIYKNNAFKSLEHKDVLTQDKQLRELVNQVLYTGKEQWGQLNIANLYYLVQAYLIKDEALAVGIFIHNVFSLKNKNTYMLDSNPSHLPIIGESETSKLLSRLIQIHADNKAALCIYGEPGVGKRTVARNIHFQRYGNGTPLLEVTCSLLNETEIAHLQTILRSMKEGTLLLNEIDQTDRGLQDRLLKLLQQKPIDIKLISITTAQLEILVKQELFLIELYERIIANFMHIPPIRQRKRDIPLVFPF
ncbi:PrpR N-terminal domain-containing protein [Virgibacillus pantothenticus]|uniref:sigma-54-dependent transcriptional regulator n=1 Tax=Virgibacillus pantothenticus TaxID=1473 RepID=UPI001C220000|nr:sigma-54-dependent transcriptional regulator [Virgibacillus pantothenticus]MBU8568249.1 PrpR N-terminal domain-containing protein [Virgibacillus pantothenticus]MBU8602289.1 PrpR N-terminal domain-containing protein [Virgibacillus pantothenticus]MBU8636423.1 PrpR N-terminal domain-containing protein [Virgibacillus pantothenticus]MBU8644161.1 PrpR N-terminal domain-containing protein [Virgibacillus pantothenticus]MBU8648342.1 PrpR N-terminal domain-containing protein [Virgibacillus pantothent